MDIFWTSMFPILLCPRNGDSSPLNTTIGTFWALLNKLNNNYNLNEMCLFNLDYQSTTIKKIDASRWLRQWRSAVPGIQRLTLNCAWASKQNLKSENWWQPTRKLRNLLCYVSLYIQTIQIDDQTKEKDNVRFTIQSQWQIQVFDKSWGGSWKGGNCLKKIVFSLV